jgi:hypothetical protein
MGVIAMIVTHNPSLERFRVVLGLAIKQTNHVVIIDNNSRNRDEVEDLCSAKLLSFLHWIRKQDT